ncbi:MAG: putative signal transducing protein [Pseudomonas sp.]
MPSMLITISRYSLPYEAHIAKSRLDAEGIPAFIADEHTINMQWLYSNAMGGVRLQVPEPYAEAAMRVLNEDREEDLLELVGADEQLCPHCGSDDTEYHQIGRRWAFLVFLGINFPLFPVRNGIKCKACGKVSKT